MRFFPYWMSVTLALFFIGCSESNDPGVLQDGGIMDGGMNIPDGGVMDGGVASDAGVVNGLSRPSLPRPPTDGRLPAELFPPRPGP